MAYHPGVGVDNLAVRAALTLLIKFRSVSLDIFRQVFIDYSEYIVYTVYKTFVCVYRGVHRMKDYKEKLISLLEKLTASQIEYIYHLACKLFGQTTD